MNTNKRLMRDVDAEEETEEEMRKKRTLQSPSSQFGSPQQGFDDGYSWLFHQLLLGEQLPSLLWSRFCDSSSCIDSGLLHQLCSSILSTEALEPSSKSVVYHLLEFALDSNDEELIQLACCAIACLRWCCGCNYVKDLSFGAGVVKKLFNLVENNNNEERKGSHDSPLQAHARLAICSIAFVDKCVREEISKKTKPGNPFEWPVLYGDKEKAEHACVIVACIVGGKKDDATWDKIEGVLIPPMVKVLTNDSNDTDGVYSAAAFAISRATYGATHAQIEKLFGMGCLQALCYNVLVLCPLLVSHCLDGIEGFLRAGAEQGNSKYVDWIAADELWPAFKFVAGIVSHEGIKRHIENKACRIAAKYAYRHCAWIKDLPYSPNDDYADDDDDDDDDDKVDYVYYNRYYVK